MLPQTNDNILDFADLTGNDKIIINNLCDRWADEIAPPTPQVRRMIDTYYKRLDDYAVRYAIDETAIAPNPSLRYFLAICRRLESEKEDENHV